MNDDTNFKDSDLRSPLVLSISYSALILNIHYRCNIPKTSSVSFHFSAKSECFLLIQTGSQIHCQALPSKQRSPNQHSRGMKAEQNTRD